jgi:hypothetical protein
MTDLVEKSVTKQESELIDEIRRAKRRKKKTETFVIRVVDGILQMQRTIPFYQWDDSHIDNQKRNR